MAHMVQCRWCKEKFDTDKVDEEKWVMPAKGQYYHIDCWNEKQLPGAIRPEVSGDEEDFTKWRDNICDFIKRDLKGEYNASRISKMMLEYKMKYKDWTYKGMFFALKYFYEIKNNSWSKANGAIGILPYIYYDGTEYWRKRERSDKGIVGKIEKQITEMKEKEIKTIPYNQQKRQRKKKALSFEELHKMLEDDE